MRFNPSLCTEIVRFGCLLAIFTYLGSIIEHIPIVNLWMISIKILDVRRII